MAVVTLIGRPSTGKTTFLSTLCQKKIAISSPVPQTTLKPYLFIHPYKDIHLGFWDNPGFYLKSHSLLQKEIVYHIRYALRQSTLILYLLDSTREPKEEEIYLLEWLSQMNKPIFPILNKIDKGSYQEAYNALSQKYLQKPCTPISAYQSSDILLCLEILYQYCVANPNSVIALEELQTYTQPFNESYYISELIRESILHHTFQEIPHAIYVECVSYKEKSSQLTIEAVIYCNEEHNKKILIGHAGKKIKAIRLDAQTKIKAYKKKKNHLFLYVKVHKHWKTDPKMIKKLLSFSR